MSQRIRTNKIKLETEGPVRGEALHQESSRKPIVDEAPETSKDTQILVLLRSNHIPATLPIR